MLALLKKVDASQTACFGAAAGALLVWCVRSAQLSSPRPPCCVLVSIGRGLWLSGVSRRYKATGCIFPPAAVVCVLMAGTPWGPTQGGAAG